MTASGCYSVDRRRDRASMPNRGSAVAFGWTDTDRAPALLWIAGLGVVGALLLALLGLPPADLHGPLHRFWGIMDPLCCGTRAVYWMAQGQLTTTVRYNPGVLALAGFVAFVYLRAFHGRLRGRWLVVRLPRRLLLAVAGVGLILLKVNQQLNAALLTRP